MFTFYDTHAHLDYPDFSDEIPGVLSRANAAGITRVISIGTDLESSRRAIALARKFENVFAAVGWHPSDAMQAPEDIRPLLREMAQEPKVVALGETGLDYYRLPSRKSGGTPEDDLHYKQRQAGLFEQHLEVAAELGLNCVVHQRESFADCLKQLQPFSTRLRAVFHCFSGTPEEMEQVLSTGSCVSFTGILTFKNGENVRNALAAAPSDRFMFETDSPFLAPVPYRGKRCEPAYVKEITEAAAQVRHCSLNVLSEQTCSTAEQFFRGLGSKG